MSDEKTRITIDIYGIQYKLMGNSSSKYMKKVAEHVSDQMHLIAKSHPRLDASRISVLAAVNIADDYFKIKEALEKSKNDPQIKNLTEAYQALEKKHERLQDELQQAAKQAEASKETERRLTEQLRHLQGQYDDMKQMYETRQRQKASEIESQQEIREQYEKLKDEYAKLQNEYNEWIQLAEQDQGRS